MKRLIYANTSYAVNVDHIDLIVIVNDARKQSLQELPIVASSYEDYDSYTIEELMELDESILRSIKSFYALDNLQTAINEYRFEYKLTPKQKSILSDYLKNREYSEVNITDGHISTILNAIKECKHITGPDYRAHQPEKNFAEVHGLEMTPSDYLAVIKSIEPSELKHVLKSADTKRLGTLMYEFIHDPKGYTLKYSKQKIESDILIYIKIIPDFQNDNNIAIISFHDPLDEEV